MSTKPGKRSRTKNEPDTPRKGLSLVMEEDMVDYRKLRVGDRLHLHTEEFDGVYDTDGVVTMVAADHALMTEPDGTRNWIDDDTAFEFFRRD